MLRQIDLKVPDRLEEAFWGLVDRLGVQAFASPCIVDVDAGEEDFRFTGETVVSFLFSTVEQPAAEIERAIRDWRAEEAPDSPAPAITDFDDNQDWMQTFRQYFQPIRVDERIIVRPPWSEPLPGEENAVTVLIDPGMAFGTGTHETTRLCLRLLADLPLEGGRYLDLGAGSGILAFYLVKRGAKLVEAVEIDGPAVENLRKNAALNHVERRLTVHCADLAGFTPAGPAQGLVANITSPVLLEHLPRLAGFLPDGGWGVFSGINSTNAPRLRKALATTPWSLEKELTEGEWHGFLARLAPDVAGRPAPRRRKSSHRA